MGETSYAIDRMDMQFKDDGTKVFVTLHLLHAPPARFFLGIEGLGVLIGQLMLAAQKMPRMMEASGASREYQESERTLESPPFNALSVQLGENSATGATVLSVQTQEGPMFTIAFEPDIWRKLQSVGDLASHAVGPKLQ